MTKPFSLIGMAATLVIAYGVDWGLKSLAETAQRTFVYEPYLWLAGPANLVLAGALVALAWFVIFRAERSKVVSSIFVIVGLLVTFSFAIIISAKVLLPIGYLLAFLTPNSHLVYAGGFMAVIGIAGFILKTPHNSGIAD